MFSENRQKLQFIETSHEASQTTDLAAQTERTGQFSSEALHYLLLALGVEGSFRNALDHVQAAQIATLEDGVKSIRFAGNNAGGFLHDTAAGLSFAGLNASEAAEIYFRPVIRSAFRIAPNWQKNGPHGMFFEVDVDCENTLRIECINAEVDPMLSGDTVAGCSVILHLQPIKNTPVTLH